jgi:hypothetical protein
MDVMSATGAGGIPSDTTARRGVSRETDDSEVGGPGAALHALFMCDTFTVLFPAGYLLRIFERVWIHIAFQSFGLFVTPLRGCIDNVMCKRDLRFISKSCIEGDDSGVFMRGRGMQIGYTLVLYL